MVNICDKHKLNFIGDADSSLCKSWYEKQDALPYKESSLPILKRNAYNFFRNISKATADEALWTTFKDYRDKIKGKGFANSFLECNSRATNEHIHKNKLAYCMNRFENPLYVKFFEKRGISINQDKLACSEMLQWIFRSQIREGKPIDIYIPSKRMRNLLIDWLNCKDVTLAQAGC